MWTDVETRSKAAIARDGARTRRLPTFLLPHAAQHSIPDMAIMVVSDDFVFKDCQGNAVTRRLLSTSVAGRAGAPSSGSRWRLGAGRALLPLWPALGPDAFKPSPASVAGPPPLPPSVLPVAPPLPFNSAGLVRYGRRISRMRDVLRMLSMDSAFSSDCVLTPLGPESPRSGHCPCA